MIGIPLGLAASNATEWAMHKYVLHGLGKKRNSFWRFHFYDHHKACRLNEGRDAVYEHAGWRWDAKGKEAFALLIAGAASLPLFPIAPFFTTTIIVCGVRYYLVHRKAHLDPKWMREHLTWHYDHHMGPDQDCNWCVTHPFFDHVMGTRQRYAFTDREAADLERRSKRKRGSVGEVRQPIGANATA